MAKAAADGVVLELTMREASVLARVLNQIGGSPDGPRGSCDDIAEALTGAGVVPAAIYVGNCMYIGESEPQP